MNWFGTRSINWEREVFQSFDTVIIVTDHENIDYKELAIWNSHIIDLRNVYQR